MIIDANNNESFLDDKPYVFSSADSLALQKYEQSYPDAPVFSASYEYFDGKAIVNAEADLIIYPYNKDRWMVTLREHRKGSLQIEGKYYFFAVSNGFTGTFFNKRNLSVIIEEGKDKSYTTPLHSSAYRSTNDIVIIGKQAYKISNITPIGNALVLEKQSDHKIAGKVGTYVGAKAPVVNTVALSGKQINVGKGKFTLLDFWGTWCLPCREELPYLKDAFIFFDTNRLEMVGIALDEEKKVKPFLVQHQLGWEQIVVKPNSRLINDYNVNVYPSSFLIDGDGKVIALQEELRKAQLLYTLLKHLNYKETDFTEWVKKGNALVHITNSDFHSLTIKGEFSHNQPLPLYLIEGKWQRALQLNPGQYSYQLSGYSQKEGAFSRKGIITVPETNETLQSLINLE